jgi:thiamine-phosphate pyrophosphorylase
VNERERIGRLHVITDVTVQSRFSHEELAELACAGGADVIQLRDKHLGDDAFIAVARRVREICARYGVTFIVNDRVEAAREVGADGVHLGRADASISEVRAVLGADTIIGASTGSVGDALAANRAGADYVGFGHIFPTTSKAKSTPPVGLEGLVDLCSHVTVPVIAIGGITADSAGEVIRAGAWGIAVIATVCTADDPRAATARLRDVVEQSSR